LAFYFQQVITEENQKMLMADVTRKNVRRAATTAFVPPSSDPAIGQEGDYVEDISQEHIIAQNEETASWLAMPASTDVKYGISPGQSYKPVLKKRTASGSTKLSEGSLAGISAIRTTKSRIDDLVKQHDDHAKHILKYYCDAYERRMGKPWLSRSSEMVTSAVAMQNVQLTRRNESETPTLKRSLTLPDTLEAHPPPIARAATIALEPLAAATFRAPLSHLQTTSATVSMMPQERKTELNALMDVQERARAEWVLETDFGRKRELSVQYLRAKHDRKRLRSSVVDRANVLEEEEEEDSDVNMAQEPAISHLQHLHPRPADSPVKPQLQSVLENSSLHPSSTSQSSASTTFRIPTQDPQRHLITSRSPSVDTTTSNESSTAPSRPTMDPRRRPSVSIGRPLNTGRPDLPKLATNVSSIGTAGSASTSSVFATPISATPTTDPRRRPISANVSATQTPITAESTAAPVAPMMGSTVTPTSGIEALQLKPHLDKARDPRRRPP